ncbi:MAG: hypothetical protein ACYC6H_00940 [Bellilinea sp.]
MNEIQMTQIVEQFSRKDEQGETGVKVIRVPDYKTVYVEQIGEVGRSVVLSEFKVDGKIYWAGYSSRSNTVFVSQASQG